MEDEFEQKLQSLDVNDELYPAMLENITELKNEKLEAVEALIKKRKRRFKFKSYFNTWKVDSIEKQIEDSMDLRKNKMIEFNNLESSAIKHITVK